MSDFLVYLRSLALARGDFASARAAAEGFGNTRVAELLRYPHLSGEVKAAIASGSTSALSKPLAEYMTLASVYVSGTGSAFDVIAPAILQIKLGFRRFSILTIGSGSGGTASEGAPKAVSEIVIDSDDLPILKASTICVVSEELLRMQGEKLIDAELRRRLAPETDSQFLGAIVDSSTPTITASGSTAQAFLNDLTAATVALADFISPQSRLFLIADRQTVATLALMPDADGARAFPDLSVTAGGSVAGVEIIPSGGVERDSSGATLTLVDATQLIGNAGSLTVDASAEALIEMQSAPTNPPTAATIFRSLWQHNEVGFRPERFLTVGRVRPQATAQIEGTSYGQAA